MLRRQASLKVTFCLFVAAATLTGCTKGGRGQFATAPVRGRVVYQGKPVANAAVTFRHTGAPRFSSGRTGADGTFELTTFQPGDGAILGENTVTVVKRTSMNMAGAVDHSKLGEAEADAVFEQTAAQSQQSEIPLKYERPETSGLTQTIVDGENDIEITLTD